MKTQKLTTQRGDTCWLDIPIPKNFQYDESLFNTKMTLDDNGVVISDVKLLKDTPRKSIFGLNNVGIINDKIELKFSGKILGDDYFEGITDLICEKFDIYGGELSLQSFDFVFKHILKHCDHMKSSHHQILINILSFIPLKMLI
jgi:hypothetical protein